MFALNHSIALHQQLFFVILLGLSFQGATVDWGWCLVVAFGRKKDDELGRKIPVCGDEVSPAVDCYVVG